MTRVRLSPEQICLSSWHIFHRHQIVCRKRMILALAVSAKIIACSTLRTHRRLSTIQFLNKQTSSYRGLTFQTQHSLNLNFTFSADRLVVGLNMDLNEWNPFWATCFSVMAFLIIVGNSLTIATLLRKKFRQRPQFLLISLAFADLVVGCATTCYVISNYRLYDLPALSLAFSLLDMFTGLSSIFHLAVISLERLHATFWPFRHRQLSVKAYWVAMATPWVLSLSVGIFTFVFYKMYRRYYYLVNYVIITISLTTSLLTTSFSYILIWVKRRRSQVRTFRQNQEARFSKTILIVTAASFITWMPFQCVIVKVLFSGKFIPSSGIFFIKLLQFSNSFVNFVIFFFRFPSYRKALFTLLTPVPRNE